MLSQLFKQIISVYMDEEVQKNFPEVPFQIFVKRIQGGTITIDDVKLSDTILSIKNKIQDKEGIPVSQQSLSYTKKMLVNTQLVQDYEGLIKGATLTLNLRLYGGLGESKITNDFIAAQIKHGNVKRVSTKESTKMVSLLRKYTKTKANKGVDDKDRIDLKIKAALVFNNAYADDDLKTMCADSILVEKLGAGNCYEMARWSAVKLIEQYPNQYVYVCALDGYYEMKATDSNFTRFMDSGLLFTSSEIEYTQNDRNNGRTPYLQFDHVMTITYPELVNDVEDMDASKAIVVDTWYNHIVCSLGDYCTQYHPFKKYKYSKYKPLILNKDDNFKIKSKNKGIGTPFSANKNAAEQVAQTFKTDIVEPELRNAQNQKYNFEFKVDAPAVLRDKRSLTSLEYLMTDADAQIPKTVVEELTQLAPDAFAKLLTTNNDEVKTILKTALANNNALITKLIKNATAGQLMTYYLDGSDDSARVSNLLTNLKEAFYAFLDNHTIFKMLSKPQFMTYLESDPNRKERLIEVALAKKIELDARYWVIEWLDANWTNINLSKSNDYILLYLAEENKLQQVWEANKENNANKLILFRLFWEQKVVYILVNDSGNDILKLFLASFALCKKTAESAILSIVNYCGAWELPDSLINLMPEELKEKYLEMTKDDDSSDSDEEHNEDEENDEQENEEDMAPSGINDNEDGLEIDGGNQND